MLTEWELGQSAWKKKLALWTYQGAHLREAACLHALTEREYRFFRKIGLRNAICHIPNGVNLPPALCPYPPAPAPWAGRVEKGRRILLYVGRINKKKGIHFLLQAWGAAIRRKAAGSCDWSLVIAGWGQFGHDDEFREQARDAGLTDSVCFLGPVFGDEKLAAFQNADAFVLPSQDEGLPLVVLEAWAAARPVLMTAQCNLPEGFAAELTLAAYRVALETRTWGTWLDLELDLWRALADTVKTWGESSRCR